jgi:hypothetical protein
MIRVYKCDYCYQTDEDILVMVEHEKKCHRNPENKTCWLCKHHVDEGYPISGSMYVCQKGKSSDFVDENESIGNCELWEQDE